MAKRRANGEGNIRKRKDGRWEGRYTAGRDPVTGKAICKNVLGKTQAEVKEKLKVAIEKSSSLVTIAERYTVGQWLDAWMENYAKLQVRPSSLKTCQRQSEIVRKRRRNFVVFRRGWATKIKYCLAQKEY